MAYGKYSRGARITRSRRMPAKRATSTYRKVTKPARQAIPALQRQVNSLRRAVAPLSQNLLQYSSNDNVNPGNSLGASPYNKCITTPSSWTRIFGGDADDESSHVFMQKSMKLKWTINWNGEFAAIDYTIMLVSLTKVGASELFNPTTGSLNTLVSGVHYINNPSIGTGGQTLLNKRYFRIHYYKNTYTLGTGGYPGEGILKRYGTITYNKPIRYLAPATDWKASVSNRNATANLYLLCFNNDNTVDTDVSFGWNCLIQGTAV